MSRLLAGEVRPLVRTLPHCPDAIRVFSALCDDGLREGTLLLESADTQATTGERTLLVLRSALHVVCRGRDVEVNALSSNGESLLAWLAELPLRATSVRKVGYKLTVSFPPLPSGDLDARLCAPSPMDVPRALMQHLHPVDAESATMPLLVGTFAYDLMGVYEDLPATAHDVFNWPDLSCGFPIA